MKRWLLMSAIFAAAISLWGVTLMEGAGRVRFKSEIRRQLLRGKFLIFWALSISVLSLSIRLSAHHGNAAYDSTKQVDLKGTVMQFIWANPHCVLLFDVTDENGQWCIGWRSQKILQP